MALEFTNNINPTGFTPGDRYWRANRPYVEGGPETIFCTPEESTYVGVYSRHSAGEESNIHIFTRINPIDGTNEERVFDINNFYWRKIILEVRNVKGQGGLNDVLHQEGGRPSWKQNDQAMLDIGITHIHPTLLDGIRQSRFGIWYGFQFNYQFMIHDYIGTNSANLTITKRNGNHSFRFKGETFILKSNKKGSLIDSFRMSVTKYVEDIVGHVFDTIVESHC